MSKSRNKRVAMLRELRDKASQYKTDMADVVELYADNTIDKYTTATSIITRLSSGRKAVNERGLQALNELRAEKEYFVTGRAKLLTTYSKHRKGAVTQYDKKYESTVRESQRVMATSAAKGQAEVCGDREGQPSRRERS